MEDEDNSVHTITNIPLDTFIQLSDSLLNEITGFIPEPWSQIAKDLDWSEATIKNTKEQLLKIFVEATYCPDNRRIEFLKQHFDDDRCKYLAECILTRKLAIAKALLKEHNASVKPVLSDFDWKVKWILGNSASTIMKYPLVELDLNLQSHNKDKTSSIFLQLNKTELDTLINVLEEEYNNL